MGAKTMGIGASFLRCHSLCGPWRWKRFLFSFLVPLILPVIGVTAENPAPTRAEARLASVTTREELTLFWEERDLYVQSATRYPKPISRAAENIAVVTAKEIEEMNAHSVDEVLNRVPGLMVEFQGQDFSPFALVHIQGSIQSAEDRHVAVYLDGVPWNYLGSGSAVTSTIPVRIIERIEIVKGPASSAWGSSLGGVVNIITRDTGDTPTPKGVVSASYGEKNTQDYNAELYGKSGTVGYYLYGGWQDSNGLRDHRATEKNRLYAKIGVTPSPDLDLHFSAAYGDHFLDNGDNPITPARSPIDISDLLATGAFAYRVSPQLSMKGSLHFLRKKFDSPSTDAFTREFRRETIYDEKMEGGSLNLSYAGGRHTVVAGAEMRHGTLAQTLRFGPLFQQPPYNQPAVVFTEPSVDKWAIFINDTIVFSDLAVTPGIRFDRSNDSGSFLSPGIGATYALGERTIARASIARGFTSPPLLYSLGGGFFIEPNPALTSERVWSYQAGMESAVTEYVNVKATLFRHDSTKEIVTERIPSRPPFKRAVNSGDVTRTGYEIEAETVPLHDISLSASHDYVRIEADSSKDPRVLYTFRIGAKYDDRKRRTAQLAGTYVRWDAPPDSMGKNAFQWDFNWIEKFRSTGRANMDLFLTVHNVTNESAYSLNFFPNPGRWVEVGARFRF